jgi:hypothetical protein
MEYVSINSQRYSSLASFQSVQVTDQAILIHYSAKTFKLYGLYYVLLPSE